MARQKKRPASGPMQGASHVHLLDQEFVHVAVDTLSRHPRNTYTGDVGAIKESMEANGFFGAVLVQKATGHILAGNHTWEAAKAKGLAKIPALLLDVDDEQALRILVADNETAKRAQRKPDAFAALIRGLKNPKGLGLPKTDLDRLLKDLKPKANLLQGPSGGSGGGEVKAGAEPGPAKAPTGEGKFPLNIVLSVAERRRWDEAKERLGKAKDKDALMAMIAEREAS